MGIVQNFRTSVISLLKKIILSEMLKIGVFLNNSLA